MTQARRIARERCFGVIIDVQEFFLAQIDKRQRSRIKTNTANFVRLLNYFQIPIVVTVERPLDIKGTLPAEVGKHLGGNTRRFEKSFFDLSKEKTIRSHLAGLKKPQAIVAGCETDVCVLQSCLGLIDLGYEVFLVEELIFSSARNVEAALARLKAEGVVVVSYKTLFYELLEAVESYRRAEKMLAAYGPFPEDLPDTALL
jgi:nicotinamidase-related amidase